MTKIWPYLFIVGVWLLFFYPVWLQGKLPIPADLIVGGYLPWLDYNWGYPAGVPVKNPAASDVVSVIYPIKSLAVDLIRQGEWPLWNWGMFNGYPLWANFQLGILFPTMIFYLWFETPIAWTLQVMAQPLIGLIGMYLLARRRLEIWPSLLTALSYGLGGFASVWLEWNVLTAAASFFPWLVYLTERYVERPTLRNGGWFSLALVCQVLVGYPQIVVFSLLGLALWLLMLSKRFKIWLGMGIFVSLGILAAAAVLIPGFELFGYSQRQGEVIDSTQNFFPWVYLIGLLVPDYFGNHSTGNFWGVGIYHNTMSIYGGVVAVTLALIGVVINWRAKEIRWLLLLLTVALIIALPNPVGQLLYQWGLWGGSAATTNRIIFLTNFVVALLAGYGLSGILQLDFARRWRLILIPLLILLGIFLGTGLGWVMLKGEAGPLDKSVINYQVALKNLIWPLMIGAIVLIVVWLTYFRRFQPTLKYVLIGLLIIELFRFGHKVNVFSSGNFLYPSTQLTESLQSYQGERMISNGVIPANMWLPYKLESPSGYDAVYPSWWADLVVAINQNQTNSSAGRFGMITNYQSPLFDLTSTRYIIQPKPSSASNSTQPVQSIGSVEVIEDSSRLPRAFLVGSVRDVPIDKQLETMISQFDPRNEALVDGLSLSQLSRDGIVNYQRLANNRIQIETELKGDGFLIVSNDYYPGWEVKIDGIVGEWYRANYAFGGVKLSPGHHLIEINYFPRSLRIGLMISLGALVLVGLMLVSSVIETLLRKRK